MFKLGDKNISKLYYGEKPIVKAYYGDKLVYNPQPIFLEYIESTGGAYIKTGLKPSYDYTIKIKYQYTNLNATFNPIFGMRTSAVGTGDNLFWAGMHYTDKQAYLRFGGNSINYALGDKALDVIEMTCSPEGIFVNGVDTGARYYDGEIASNALEIYLFTLNNQGAPNGGLGETTARVYSYEVYDGNMNLIQELMPCISPSGKVGMYDSVTNKYFYNQDSGELKAGYIPLDYVITDGSSYVNTGYLPNENTYIEYTFEVLNASESANHQGVFGSRKDQTEEGYNFNVFVRSTKYLRIDWGVYTGDLTAYSLNTKYTIKAGLGEVYLDNELVKTYTVPATGTSPYSIYLGNFNNAGKPYTSGSIQNIYGFKVYENNVLLHDFKPCIHPTTKQVGFYDLITSQYFFNAGAGTLKAGGRFVNSILFDGASYIDTGIAHQTCTVECDIKFKTTGARQLMGFGFSTAQYWGASATGTFDYVTSSNATVKNNVVIEFNTDDTTAPTRVILVNGQQIGNVSTGSNITQYKYSIGAVGTSIKSYWCTCEVWGNKTTINGEVIQDLRPYVDEDGVACFKDIVTNTLFYNQGTGTLKYT